MSLVDEIRQVRFKSVRRHGYDPEQVDDFLDHLVAEITGLTSENERLRAGSLPLGGQGATSIPPDSYPNQFPR